MRRAWALGAVVACAAASLAAGAGRIESSKCFGAASRDPAHPCHDRALDHVVKPTPRDVVLVPNAYCRPIERDGPASFYGGIGVCAFGVAPEQAVATFALIGDSHAMTWRAALEVVAQAKRWRGLSITRSRCALSTAAVDVTPRERRGCVRWNSRVIAWLARHPEIQTVFVTGRVTTPVLVKRDRTAFATKADGYRGAWARLPQTVRHVVVIRDNPQKRFTTFGCIHAAVAAHRNPGLACAMPRAAVLPEDPAIAAARRLGSPRVQTVDLTSFMCDARRCYPVVGGALVNKDPTHLATGFSTTLGPYLLRRLDALMAGWPR